MSAVHEGALAIYTRWGGIGLSYSFFQTLPSNIHLGVESRSNAEAKLRNQNPKAKVQQLKAHGYLNPFGAHKVAQRTSGTWTYYKVTESFFSRSGEGGEWRETGGGGSVVGCARTPRKGAGAGVAPATIASAAMPQKRPCSTTPTVLLISAAAAIGSAMGASNQRSTM